MTRSFAISDAVASVSWERWLAGLGAAGLAGFLSASALWDRAVNSVAYSCAIEKSAAIFPSVHATGFLLSLPRVFFPIGFIAALLTMFPMKWRALAAAATIYVACIGAGLLILWSIPQECWDRAD